MKWQIIILLGVMMISINEVTASEGYGNCPYGLFPFGNCVSTATIIGGSQVFGGGCNNGFTYFYGYCIDPDSPLGHALGTLTSQQLGDITYTLYSPNTAITSQTVALRNSFYNKGDYVKTLRCVNFLDANYNGKLDKNEQQSWFNLNISPHVTTNHNNTIIIPEVNESTYLIGGICSYQSLNITSANQLSIKQGLIVPDDIAEALKPRNGGLDLNLIGYGIFMVILIFLLFYFGWISFNFPTIAIGTGLLTFVTMMLLEMRFI